MRIVLDTNVLVAALRSRTGASNPLVIAGLRRQFEWCCSVPLFYECEDVLNRAEFLLASGLTRQAANAFLDDIAAAIIPVGVAFQWRHNCPTRTSKWCWRRPSVPALRRL